MMRVDNPLVGVSDERLERMAEDQHRLLEQSVRAGDIREARLADQALDETEGELRRRGKPVPR